MTSIEPFERHELPSGDVVYYRDDNHSYYRDIKPGRDGYAGVGRLAGVSTVVGPFDWRPDALMKWSARMNGDGVAALAAEGLGCEEPDDIRAALNFLTSGDAIWGALDDAGLLYSQLRDDAARRGTNVHKHALHALATGSAVPDLSAMTEEERGYARGVMRYWLEHEPQPNHAETVVCDLGLGVAGRLDLIHDGGVVLDAKTSSYVPVKHHVQIAGYIGLAQTCSLIDGPASGEILQVTADGDYELIPVTATWEDFLAAVEVYRRNARIQREARANRKEALAA